MNYLLSFRSKRHGGPVVPGRLIQEDGLGKLEDLQLESSVTVLVHGFNVDYSGGKQGLLQLADMLPSAVSGAIVAVLWPGDHWSGPLSYSFEGRDADDTALELARYLDDNLRPDASMSFVAHSLGCRVTMETVSRLLMFGREPTQICLMAPAIDDDSLAAPGEYRNASNSLERIAALSSRKDKVLKYAYPAGDLLQAFVFWDDSGDYALGYHGPRKHKKSGSGVPATVLDWRIKKRKKVGHGDYIPDSPPNDRQKAAAAFADAVVSGGSDPVYK